MSDLVTYHTTNPDVLIPGCRNTGMETDGVCFQGIEPLEGAFCFVGRQSILEAVSVLYELPLNEAVHRITNKQSKRDAEVIDSLQERVNELELVLSNIRSADNIL